jgi:hypothetical protein
VEKAVTGWLRIDPKPLGAVLGKNIKEIDTFTDDSGQPSYYVVYLQPTGFVIVPADDLVEPIIGFVAVGTYNPSDDRPLGALVSRDVPGRILAARDLMTATADGTQKKGLTAGQAAFLEACFEAQSKWASLQVYADSVGTLGLSSISDVWVPPFVQSTWGQKNVGGFSSTESCYNYYTPPGPDGDNTSYPCGCVATAMAQLMRFYQYPTAGIGVHGFTIQVDGSSETAYTRGGNGSGGAYQWGDMPLQPEDGVITLTQRKAIGALCYDASVTIETSYYGGGSLAFLSKAKDALLDSDLFDYSNAINGWNNNNNIGAGLVGMVNPNLDAGYPVILGIRGTFGGHGVLADGYGYNSSTPYHHISMGWDGYEDAWYNLPDIDCPYPGPFNIIDETIYNVFVSGTGEIISGRVTGPGGIPVSGVAVSATGGYNTTSDERGIYALANVPSGTSFTVSASKEGWSFSNQPASTGTSVHDVATSGNVWGVDFSGTISAGYIELDKETYEVPETVTITLVDSDLAGNGTQNVVVTACGGDYETVTLSENPGGSGTFEGSIGTADAAFIVEDGTIQVSVSEMIIAIYEDADDGTASPATVRETAIVIGLPAVLYLTNFTSAPTDWTVVDGYTDGYTWSWTGTYVIVDSNAAGYVWMDEELISPAIDCSGYETVTLAFQHKFVYYEAEIGDVDVQVGGGPWQNVVRYQGQHFDELTELDISSFAAGQADVRIRWRYWDAYWDWYWAINGVRITGSWIAQQNPADFEPDCDVDFNDYAVLAAAWRSSSGESGWNPACDISDPSDGVIDERDLKVLTDNWLAGASP